MKYNLYHILVIILTACVLFTGCAATPEEDAVISRNDDSLEKVISDKSQEDTIFDDTDAISIEKVANDAGNVEISNSGEFSIPDVDAYPVIEVTRHKFTDEDCRNIITVLFPDCDIYEYTQELTRQEIENKVNELRYKLTDEYLDSMYDTEASKEDAREFYTEQLNDLQARYEAAEDEVERTRSDFTFHDSDYYAESYGIFTGIDGVECMFAETEYLNTPYVIWFSRRDDDSYKLNNINIWAGVFKLDNLVDESEFYQSEDFSQENIDSATESLYETVNSLNMGTWSLNEATVESSDAGYYLTTTWVRCYNGMPSTDLQIDNIKSEDSYAPGYYYESLEIQWADGKIIGFNLMSPLDIVEVKNDNAALLSVSEAVQRINSQLFLQYTPNTVMQDQKDMIGYCDEITKVGVNITETRLRLVRISIKDEPDIYYLIPAWVVYGTYGELEYRDSTGNIVQTEADLELGEVQVLTVINALDGSFIDLEQGY